MIETNERREIEHRRALLVHKLDGLELMRQSVNLDLQHANIDHDIAMNTFRSEKLDTEKEIADLDAWLAKNKKDVP